METNQRIAHVDPYDTWGFNVDTANPVRLPESRMSIHSKWSCRLSLTENHSIVVIPIHCFTVKISENHLKHIPRTMNFQCFRCNVPGRFLVDRTHHNNILLKPTCSELNESGTMCSCGPFICQPDYLLARSFVRFSDRLEIFLDIISFVLLSIMRCFTHYFEKACKAWSGILHADVSWPPSEKIRFRSKSTGFPHLVSISSQYAIWITRNKWLHLLLTVVSWPTTEPFMFGHRMVIFHNSKHLI